MGDPVLSEETYKRVYKETKEKGSATFVGEQRAKEGKGLHEMVDPSSNGVIRRSISWLEPNPDGTFTLLRGTAMLEETRLDTTGSLGGNVAVAMKVLINTHNLYKKVMVRYDIHMITSIFGDTVDKYILCRSHAEMDEKIATQMTYMLPEKDGGDWTEDPQYGLFGGAYLTSATIKQLGLKSYDFTITDADARNYVSLSNLKRVFGNEVLEKAAENGWPIDANKLPSTKEIVTDLLKTTHAFVLVVDGPNLRDTIDYWNQIFGRERVVVLPEVRYLPIIKAVIIGLTEGTLQLSEVENFITTETDLSTSQANKIKMSVAGIPIGAQMMCENFDKIPLIGDIFAQKGDLWPIKKATEVIPENEGDIWK
jgi:hypothetical protein